MVPALRAHNDLIANQNLAKRTHAKSAHAQKKACAGNTCAQKRTRGMHALCVCASWRARSFLRARVRLHEHVLRTRVLRARVIACVHF